MSNTIRLNTCPKCGAPIPPEAPQGLCPKCVLGGAASAAETGLSPTATSEIPTLGRVAAAFPQLEIIELIGRGGMGFVFKARQPHLDRWVALKLLPDKLAKDAHFAERFNREGRVLAKLNHPNIVSIFDFGQTGGFYFLLMEFVDGVNLRQAMQAGRFSPSEALAVVPKICEALQYAHEQGVLHRDIKPENILLDARGRVKIADFGIAKLVGEEKPDVSLTATGVTMGTLHYMAPEQLEKPSTVDHRADIYSLGVVFYEMLTGELPIGRFAPPSARTPVAVGVDEVVFRTLEKDREKRFQSAGEVQTKVQTLAEQAAGAIPPTLPSEGDFNARHSQLPPVAQITSPVPRFSRRAIWGAALTGLSLPFPFLLLCAGFLGWGGIGSAELALALAGIMFLGVPGLILGWMGLIEIRNGQGQVHGLPLAVFAALTWPAIVLGGATFAVPAFTLYLSKESGGGGPGLPARVFALLLPAGALTFVLWAIHATVRWANGQQTAQRRGVLKWVFLGLMATGLGLVVLPNVLSRQRTVSPPSVQPTTESTTVNGAASNSAAAIQFTFTNVEIREEEGARWLAMDYVQQIRGDCERTLRYDARVPGFTAVTRTKAFMSDTKDGFAPVLHQSVSWKLPDSLPQPDALTLRDLVAREWVGKSAAIEPDDERILFKALVPNGGTLAAAVGVKIRTPSDPDARRKLDTRLNYLLNREQELSTQVTPENSLMKDVRRQITETRAELERLGKAP